MRKVDFGKIMVKTSAFTGEGSGLGLLQSLLGA